MSLGYGDGKGEAANARTTKTRSANGALPSPAGRGPPKSHPAQASSLIPLRQQEKRGKQQRALRMWGRPTGTATPRHRRVPAVRGCSKGRHRLPTGLSGNFTSSFPPLPTCKNHLSSPVRQFSSHFLLHPAAGLFPTKRRRQPKLVFVQPRRPIQRALVRGIFTEHYFALRTSKASPSPGSHHGMK